MLKKLHSKLLASMLSVSVLCSAAPAGALNVVLPEYNTNPKKGLSIGEQLAIGFIGVAVVTAAGVVIYNRVGGSSEDPQEQIPPGNRNFTNTEALCFWHSFMQQMYSLTAFRAFIEDAEYCNRLKQDINEVKQEIEEIKNGIESAKKSGQTAIQGSSETVTTTTTTTVSQISSDDDETSEEQSDDNAADVAPKGSSESIPQWAVRPENERLYGSIMQVANRLDQYLPRVNGEPVVAHAAASSADAAAALSGVERVVNSLSKACDQMAVIREIFQEMSDQAGGRISAEQCKKFAEKIFKDQTDSKKRPILGWQQDISDNWQAFIKDVNDVYAAYCSDKGFAASNILGWPLKLGLSYRPGGINSTNLLHYDEPTQEQKRNTLQKWLSRREDPPYEGYEKYTNQFNAWRLLNDLDNKDGLVQDHMHRIEGSLIGGGICDCKGPFAEELKKLSLLPIDVPVIDDQFVVFVGRGRQNPSGGRLIKDDTPIDFGDGKLTYNGEEYELTAISVHFGSSLDSGHYVTYKKEHGTWRLYNDCSRAVEICTWPKVKRDAETNCAVLTFSRVNSGDAS